MFNKNIKKLLLLFFMIILIIGGVIVKKRLTHHPDISVIISSYNMADTLPNAINSILEQTFQNWELIIIDDGSTDNTLDVLKPYMKYHPKIRFIRNDINMGLVISLNKGLDMARGKYIARLDADDTAYPDRLSRQFQFMEENKLDLSSGQRDTPETKNIEQKNFPDDRLDSFQLGFSHLSRNMFGHPMTIFRKSFLDDHNLRYNVNRPNAEDYDLWLQIFLNGGKLGIMGGRPITTYHFSGHSRNWWQTSDNSILLSREEAFRKIIPNFSKKLSEMSKCDQVSYLIKGNKKTGVLNQTELEQMELSQCLPDWEFIHPYWKDHFRFIGGNRFTRTQIHDVASIKRDGDKILVKWEKWVPEHFICQDNRCIKSGYTFPSNERKIP